jgi:hypothetical protein
MLLYRAARLLRLVRQLQKWNGWSDLYASTDTNDSPEEPKPWKKPWEK